MATLSLAEAREKEIFQVRIEGYGFRGEGYSRLSDGWLSIPGALPGERVTIRIQQGQRQGARRLFADLLEVHESSTARRDPLCPRVAICKGCQLRHLTIAEELRFKVQSVRDVISRYGDLSQEEQPPVEVITPQPIARGDAFRIRTNLRFRRRDQGFELGLFSASGPSLITMHDCPALTKSARRLVSVVERSLKEVRELPLDEAMDVGAGPLGLVAIHVAAPTYGVGLIDVQLTDPGDLRRLDRELESGAVGAWLGQLAEMVTEYVGLSVKAGSWRRLIKEPRRISIPIDKWQMQVGFDDWFHATLEPAEEVYAHLMRWLELKEFEDFLDVGCGTGTISLMASELARDVVGIDINEASIESAELNALYHERENIRFIVGGWEKGLRRLVMEGARFSAATINPMRKPLGRRALVLLHALGVERLVYLGPSPVAAARDIRELRRLGFVVEKLAAANLHPATYHTLLMASLSRRGSS